MGEREEGVRDSPQENQNAGAKGSGKEYWLGQTIDIRYLSSLKTSQILIDIALRILSRQQQSMSCFPHLFVQDTFQFSSVAQLCLIL